MCSTLSRKVDECKPLINGRAAQIAFVSSVGAELATGGATARPFASLYTTEKVIFHHAAV
jgi:hypothetical protein